MKSILYFYFLYFCFKNGIEAVETTTQTIPSQASFENLTIQNLLKSGVTENDEVEQKFLQGIKDFASNNEYYSPIRLMTDISIQGNPMILGLGSGYTAVLNGVTIQHLSSGPKRYDTTVECDLVGNTKVYLVLSDDLKITTQLKLKNSSDNGLLEDELKSSSDNLLIEGEFYATLSAVTIVAYKTFPGEGAIKSPHPRGFEMKYQNAVMKIETEQDERVQSTKNIQWDVVLQKLESVARAALEKELFAQIREQKSSTKNDSLLLFCASQVNKNNSLPPNSNLNSTQKPSYYLISGRTTRIRKTAILKVEPIVLEGLSNFHYIELQATANELEKNSNMKLFATSLKTGPLKGKFEWNFYARKTKRNCSSVSSFVLEFVRLESAVGYLASGACFQNLLKVHLGGIQMNGSDNVCENERFSLKPFLSAIITTHLENTITTKLNNDTAFSLCPALNQWWR